MSVLRVLTVALGVLGIVMLISGIALRHLDEEGSTASERVPMPEEYIEEFFSAQDNAHDIEDIIEAE
jgi:hypothetical protein